MRLQLADPAEHPHLGALPFAVDLADWDLPHMHGVLGLHRHVVRLVELGHDVVEVPMPVDDAQLARDFLTTWFVHCAVSLEQAREAGGAGEDAFEPDTRVMAALGRATSATDYVRAVESRHTHVRRLAAFHADHDLLLTPTTATPPPRALVVETPLLFEAGMEGAYDATIAIVADEALRADRDATRGHAAASERAARQLPQDEKARRATFAVANDGSVEDLERALTAVLENLGPPEGGQGT